MPSFSNITSLSQYVKNNIKEINKSIISKEAKRQYEKAIQDTVYKQPSVWQTGSFGESVNTSSRTTKHTSSVKVFVDEQLMSNSYPSIVRGGPMDNRAHIGWWLEDGHGGIFAVSGRYYFKLLMTEYFSQKVYKETMIRELSRRGIQAR